LRAAPHKKGRLSAGVLFVFIHGPPHTRAAIASGKNDAGPLWPSICGKIPRREGIKVFLPRAIRFNDAHNKPKDSKPLDTPEQPAAFTCMTPPGALNSPAFPMMLARVLDAHDVACGMRLGASAPATKTA